MFTCRKPYSDNKKIVKSYFKFASEVGKGLRPGPLPEKPNDVVELIRSCWDGNPLKRPAMSEVSEKIKLILERRFVLYSN